MMTEFTDCSGYYVPAEVDEKLDSMQAEIDKLKAVIKNIRLADAEAHKAYRAKIDALKVLLEAKDHVIDCAITLKTSVGRDIGEATRKYHESLEPFMPDVQTIKGG